MRIVDNGSVVEFYLNANSSTFAYNLPWGYYYNGAWSSYRDFSFTGGAWRKLGQITVNDSQTVGFRIGDSGTNGLGGPTSFTVSIDRVEVPPAPTLAVTSFDQDSISVNSNSNGNGGGTVDQWQLGYSTSSSGPTAYKNLALADGTGTITGLAHGTYYYLWARRHNEKGWGPWSSRVSVKTWKVPDAPSAVVLSNVKQTSVHAKFSGNGNGGTSVLEWQIGYGTSSTAPQLFKSGYDMDITGLEPGVKYYFWARGRNAVGWGPYSTVVYATTIPGARIMWGGVRKNAIPYVKVNGVWRIAEPYVKIGGLWKNTG